MAKKIKIDFFTVSMPTETGLHEITSKLFKKNKGKHRNELFNGAPIRMQDGGDIEDHFCQGDMLRMQMDGLPTDAGLDGTAQRIALANDHGLGHETAFLYYIPWNILLLQRNKSGVSPAAMARYLEAKGGLENPVQLDWIPLKSADAKLRGFKRYRSLRVRMAAVGDLAAYENDNLSASGMLDVIAGAKTPKGSTAVIDVRLSVKGPHEVSIDRSGFLAIVDAIKKIPASVASVERMDIRASDSDETKLEVLHYLDFFLTDEQPVKSIDRAVPYHQRAAALRKSFESHRDQLKKLLKKTEPK